MPKSTLYFIFALALIATLLIGINIGKNISSQTTNNTSTSLSASKEQITNLPISSPYPSYSPSATLQPTTDIRQPTPRIRSGQATSSGSSTYTDSSCGFSFSYPGGYLSSNTVNGKSVILTDPDDESQQIIGACEDEIPKPPLSPEKVESIIVDGVTTNLYHDADSQSGKPRDEIIVRHPTNGKEIIIAGFGDTYNAALASFKFIQ